MQVHRIDLKLKRYLMLSLLIVFMVLAAAAISQQIGSNVLLNDHVPALSIDEAGDGYDVAGKPCKFSPLGATAETPTQKGVTFKSNGNGTEIAVKMDTSCGYAWSD